MAHTVMVRLKKSWQFIRSKLSFRISITTKLILSFLLIIVITSAILTLVGIQLIGDRIVAEAQEKVRVDLNSAREIYLNNLSHINNVVGSTADRFFLKDAILTENMEQALDELVRVKEKEGLDVLTITDKYGYVLLRTSNPELIGDNQGHDDITHSVLLMRQPVATTTIITSEDLQRESPLLADQAYFEFIDTPRARSREETEEASGMMLKAAAPIFDTEYNLIGTVYGGVLLNNNFEIVDKVKQTVYQDVKYEGQDIGTATIFQDDVRISTNVKNEGGSRALGTRVAEVVYNQVVIEGEPWIERAYVVNNWYIAAYEPIRDLYGRIIGILYVGVLEQKYEDIQNQTVYTFMTITIAGVIVSLLVSYFISRMILVPINKLVAASKAVADGDLDARVDVNTNDELQYLAESFNTMAISLQERDERLKEFTRSKIMESERLALVGQLSANVAHELNNPLTGIVTYSHLLLEKLPNENSTKDSLQKIIIQADRCRDIIRGLLDFSRQRKPDKTLCDINDVLLECTKLLEDQALFHNIKITKEFGVEVPLAIIDPSQIERVFINMIINAAEAIEGNGTLRLETRLDRSEQFIEVIFSDNGPGITEENLRRIFDPFFTTKEVGHGTGLGLAISYGIVKEHGGIISVKSVLGNGTTFIVRLPVTVEERV